MKVKVYCINRGAPGQYFGLMNAEDHTPLSYAPTWKTGKGAEHWARKHGYEIAEGSDKG